MEHTDLWLYILTKDGAFLKSDYLKILIDITKEDGYLLQDIGMGSAYNMPTYLLDEMEIHLKPESDVIVVAWDYKDDFPKPMFFAGNDIFPLRKALFEADKNDNSWNICKEVHGAIR